MKKGNIFLTLLLSAALVFSPSAPSILAEDEGYEEEWTEGTEEETEHPESYYKEIQSNLIPGWPQGEAVNANAAVLMDADTGAILYAKDIDRRYYPASITKIMTTLLALENGNLDDVVTFSENAVYSIEYGSSHLGLTEGEKLTLEQCLYGIMLASANEISNAVAEHIGGDIETFAKMMNDRAAELGCENTHFVNPHGLHDEDHYTCARDMALIMREALKNEKFCEIIGTVEYNYPETNKVKEVRYFMNHHKMIAEEGMLYDGCIGGKNGYTDDAWNTLVTAAERDGQKLIAVVLKVPGQYVSYEDTKVLLDYGFANFRDEQIDIVNAPNMEITGVDDEAELVRIRAADILKAPFSMIGSAKVTLPKDADSASLAQKMDFNARTLTYTYEGQAMGSVPFGYTGDWEPEPPAETAAAETGTEMAETETTAEEPAADTAGGALGAVGGFFRRIADGGRFLYTQMDEFIEKNTVVAAVLGAILLLIFIPLLLLAVNRHRKYLKMLELRENERQMRERLEREIEEKSAAQVEAELRAEELQAQLEEERRKQRVQDTDEYIEVELKDGEPLD